MTGRRRDFSEARRRVVLALAVHPPALAATRLRVSQYRPFLAEQGLDLQLWTFLSERDLADWYGGSDLRRVLVVLRGLLRLPVAVGRILSSDVVLVQREALPAGPPLLERLAARLRPVAWDVDDAVWEQHRAMTAGRAPRWVRAPRGKYERLCARADLVLAGSELLAAWCRAHNTRVLVVPTVVPVPDEPPPGARDGVVAWVGSHSTGPFLADVLPAVARVRPLPRVEAVGARVGPVPGVDVVERTWSAATEEEVLSRARVGLYPVDRAHPLADGKCGFKAVLYMAHGVPVVVTPTPTNAAIVRDGVDGLHADTAEQWERAVSALLSDDELWESCRRSAHSRARDEYSLQRWGPVVAIAVRELADAERKER